MCAIRVACIGEAMVELSLDSARPDRAGVGFAGDTLNTAIYLKRSLPALQVSYVTRLGRDRFSDQLERFISKEGLDTDQIGRSDTRSVGLYAISTDAAGERSFSYWRDSSAARTLFREGNPALEDMFGFDVLYFSAITLAILSAETREALLAWLPEYRIRGGRVVFDSNYRPALWQDRTTAQNAVMSAWAQTDIALPSLDDEMALFEDADEAAVMTRLRGCGIKSGALKRGAEGPLSIDPTAMASSFATVGKVVDSTAAGDSFNGGYLAAKLARKPQVECLQAGHDLAVRVIGVKGAILPV